MQSMATCQNQKNDQIKTIYTFKFLGKPTIFTLST